MATANTPEFWLRGPVDGVHPALMPAAHAFLQTLEDVERATVLGLLFHAAEHSQRHAGQIVTTARVVRSLI